MWNISNAISPTFPANIPILTLDEWDRGEDLNTGSSGQYIKRRHEERINWIWNLDKIYFYNISIFTTIHRTQHLISAFLLCSSRPKFTSTNPLPGAAKPKSNKSKDLLPHDFKTLYTNEFKEENLTFEQVKCFLQNLNLYLTQKNQYGCKMQQSLIHLGKFYVLQ